jgi:hypothetical protein
MDLDAKREMVERILRDYAAIPYAHGDIQRVTVFDRPGDHYLLVIAGWDRHRRVHGCIVHVDIIDGKFWIQRDGTECGIARELVDAGVPKDHIVLAWKSPEVRKLTGYAVA